MGSARRALSGGVGGFGLGDGGAEAVEGCGGTLWTGRGRLLDGAGAAGAGDQEFGFGAGLGKLLLETVVGGAEVFGLGGLILQLLGETFGQLLAGEGTLERGAGEIVLLAPDGQLGFVVPLLRGGFVLLALLLEEMLVGDGDGYLRLHLQELVFHVED